MKPNPNFKADIADYIKRKPPLNNKKGKFNPNFKTSIADYIKCKLPLNNKKPYSDALLIIEVADILNYSHLLLRPHYIEITSETVKILVVTHIWETKIENFEIDPQLYELFELTEEEIKIVEGHSNN